MPSTETAPKPVPQKHGKHGKGNVVAIQSLDADGQGRKPHQASKAQVGNQPDIPHHADFAAARVPSRGRCAGRQNSLAFWPAAVGALAAAPYPGPSLPAALRRSRGAEPRVFRQALPAMDTVHLPSSLSVEKGGPAAFSAVISRKHVLAFAKIYDIDRQHHRADEDRKDDGKDIHPKIQIRKQDDDIGQHLNGIQRIYAETACLFCGAPTGMMVTTASTMSAMVEKNAIANAGPMVGSEKAKLSGMPSDHPAS